MHTAAQIVDDDTHPAIMLHSSASCASQWRDLVGLLNDNRKTFTPEQWGCGGAEAWPGDRAFTLAEEAIPVIRLIEQQDQPVHLIGHSYGGGVALHIARRIPHLIASLTLIEPTAFHLLIDGSAQDQALFREVQSLEETVSSGLLTGRFRSSMQHFVDYWNGTGTSDQLSPERMAVLIKRFAKLPLDFRALMYEATAPEDLHGLHIPTLVIRGGRTQAPASRVAEIVHESLPHAEMITIPTAGHMAPMTHSKEVNPRIHDHIRRHDQSAQAAV